MYKDYIVDIYNRILFCIEKEGDPTTSNNMGDAREKDINCIMQFI